MSFRFEKKFLFTKKDFIFFKKNFLSKYAFCLFPQREINSLYYDTKELDNFYDSEEGTLPRIKIRIRNYNKQDKFFKEIKISSSEGRFKISEGFKYKNIKNKNQVISFQNNNYLPNIFTNYLREYYSYSNLRITIDKNIKYSNYHTKKIYFDNNIILELKSKNHIDYNHEIFKKLNFTDTRYSKYVNAIKCVKNLDY